MKRTFSTIAIISIITLLFNHNLFSQDIEVSLDFPNPLSGTIETMENRTSLTFVNNTPQTVPAYLRIEISGISGEASGISASNELSTLSTRIDISTGTTIRTYSDLAMSQDGYNFEDFDYDFANDTQEKTVLEQRRLPQGQYRVCIEVRDSDFDNLLSVPLENNCYTLNIVWLNPPRISVPNNATGLAWVAENPENSVDFQWSVQNAMGFPTYELVVKKFANVNQLSDFLAQGRPQDMFNGLELVDEVSTTNLIYNSIEDNLLFETEQYYACQVTAISDEDNFLNEGRSQINVFTYGLADHLVCDNPSYNANIVFPMSGDTLPYRHIPIITKIDPLCDNIMNTETGLRIQKMGQESDQRPTTYVDWVGGPGPYNEIYQQCYFNDPDRIDYWIPDPDVTSYFSLDNYSEDIYKYDRGNAYRASAYIKLETKKLAGVSNSVTQSIQLNDLRFDEFHSGMPTPKLLSPVPDARIYPGTVALKFNGGDAPTHVVPPLKMYVFDGNRAVMPVLQVYEKSVLQVSRNSDFDEEGVMFTEVLKLQVNCHDVNQSFDPMDMNKEEFTETNDFFPDRLYDQIAIQEKIYDEERSINFTSEELGDFYWRVVWLKDPDAMNLNDPHGQGVHITEDMFYRKSATRKFTLTLDADHYVDEEITESNNTPTDCSSPCQVPSFDQAKVSSIGEIESFKAGYFSVESLQIESKTDGKLTGKGVVKIDFLENVSVAVEFEDLRLNSFNEMVTGKVTAISDGEFDLKTINETLEAQGANAEGIGDVIRPYLEAYDETKIVGNLLFAQTLQVPFGTHFTVDGSDLLLGISGIEFNPDGAKVNVVYEQHFDKMGADNWISLGGKFCLKPSGFGDNILVHFNNDFVIRDYDTDEESKDFQLKIKGESSSSTPDQIKSKATHLELHCGCVKSFGLQLEAEFDKEVLMAENAEGELTGKGAVAKIGILLNRSTECDPTELEDVSPTVRGKVDENNFMVNFSMDPFQIKGLEGWGFSLDKGVVDFSSLENPEEISFPSDYEHEALETYDGASAATEEALKNTWSGFYLKELSVRAPKEWYKEGSDRRFSAGIKDVIIDETGISGSIFASDIVEVEETEYDFCSFSIDTLKVKIIQNAFRSGSFKGEFDTPISKENFDYNAVLSFANLDEEELDDDTDQWGFIMSINPAEDMTIPMLIAKVHLEDNSYIHMQTGYVDESEVEDADTDRDGVSIFLDGKIDFGGEEAENSEAEKKKKGLYFAGIEFDLKYNSVDGFEFNHKFDAANPFDSDDDDDDDESSSSSSSSSSDEDKNGKLAGFDFGLSDISVENVPSEDGFIKAAKFNFSAHMGFVAEDDGGLQANGKFAIYASLNEQDEFECDSIQIKCIGIGISTAGSSGDGEGSEISGVKIKGEVCFYEDEMRCEQLSTGFTGKLEVGLPFAKIDLKGDFGSTPDYSYFGIEGMGRLTEGAPMGALQLLGIGGGFYYNMKIDRGNMNPEQRDGDLVAMASDSQEESPGDVTEKRPTFKVCPDEGTFIIKLGCALATTGDKSIFNMDVGITAQVETASGLGLTHLSIMGDGYVMTEIEKRKKAPIKTDIKISFDRYEESNVYRGDFDIYVDYKNESETLKIKGGGGEKVALDEQTRPLFIGSTFLLKHYFDESVSDTWYFKLGSPTQPGRLDIDLAGIVKANSQIYLQIGNSEIDQGFLPLPTLITNMLTDPKTSDDGGEVTGLASADGPRQPLPESRGAGFTTGLSLETKVELDLAIIYARLALAVGFDMSLMKTSEGAGCFANGELISPIGFDGWYTTGRVYAGVKGEVGLDLWLGEVPILELGAAFMIQGGFPSPAWFEGRATVYFNIVGVKGSETLVVSAGEKCVPPVTDPFGFAIIDQVMPGDGKENVSANVFPKVSFNLPVDEILEVPRMEETSDGELRMVTDELRPYIAQVKLKDKTSGRTILNMQNFEGNNSTTDVYEWNDENNIMTIMPEESLPSMDLELTVIVRGKIRRNGIWQNLEIDNIHGSGKIVWIEERVTNFKTGPLPKIIDDGEIIRNIPYDGQRHVHKDDYRYRDGAVYFIRNKKNDYFYTQNSNGKYKYEAHLYPMDGSPVIKKDVSISSSGKSITYDMPSLKNDMMYKVNIVRRQTHNSAGISTVQLEQILASGLNGGSGSVAEDLLADFKLKYNDPRFSELGGDVFFTSKARKLVPGESNSSPFETIVHKNVFKTSKYSEFKTKMQNANLENEPDHLSDDELTALVFLGIFGLEDNILENKLETWMKLTSSEGFDQFDLKEYRKITNNARLHVRKSIVGAFESFESNKWTQDLRSEYTRQLASIEKYSRNYGKYDHPTNRFRDISTRITTGRLLYKAYDDDGNRWARKEILVDPLIQADDFNLQFYSDQTDTPKAYQFTNIDPNGLLGPISNEDVQLFWDQTVVDAGSSIFDNFGMDENPKNGTSQSGKGKGSTNPFNTMLIDIPPSTTDNASPVFIKYDLAARAYDDMKDYWDGYLRLYNKYVVVHRYLSNSYPSTLVRVEGYYFRDHLLAKKLYNNDLFNATRFSKYPYHLRSGTQKINFNYGVYERRSNPNLATRTTLNLSTQ